MENPKNPTNQSHSSNLFILIEQYLPVEGKLEAVLKIAKESAKSIKGIKGLIMSQVLRPKTQTDPICNITTWESENAFNTFIKSDAVKNLYASDMMANVKAWTSNIEAKMFTLEEGWH